jgi:oligoribonuclease NrnB/cAMP/cGMP phosphodiesterase (DHH superfamily)
MVDVIIYHSPCSDGVVSLWIANNHREIPIKIPCKAGQDPEIMYTNKSVLIVDICPSIQYISDLARMSKKVVILDHHKSSENMILNASKHLRTISNLHIEFDMTRSACQMTWDYFYPRIKRPFFVDYVGDRDLWQWKLPHSREINTAMYELGYIDQRNLSKLTELYEDYPQTTQFEYIRTAGDILEESKKKELNIAAKCAIETTMNDQYKIWLGGNISPKLRSEFGERLCSTPFKDGSLPQFAALWQYDPRSSSWWISLRAANNSPDLAQLTATMGGGGHEKAAGFTIRTHEEFNKIFNIKTTPQ